MSHLDDKLADYVFGELSSREMAEASSHLQQCSECRIQVKEFESTRALLSAAPVVDPPRPMVFEFEKPRAVSWIWRWLAPMSASAAVAFAVVTLTPRPQPQIVEKIVQQPVQAVPAPKAEPIDYQKLIDQIHAEDRAWLVNELSKRDQVHAKEFQRVRGEMAYLDAYQRAMEKETWDNASSIQLLATKR